MEELIKTFHIDLTGIIGQLVNFAIVLAVLHFFAIKPLLKIMHDRSHTIDTSLKQAALIEKQSQEAEEQRQEAIIEGRHAAQAIMTQAEQESEALRKQKVEKTRKETEKIVADAKSEITAERATMLHSLRTELADLVLLASNKLTQQTLSDATHKKMIAQVIDDLKKTDV